LKHKERNGSEREEGERAPNFCRAAAADADADADADKETTTRRRQQTPTFPCHSTLKRDEHVYIIIP
jgi:hypothetical protein